MKIKQFLTAAGWVSPMNNADWYYPDANHPHLHLRVNNSLTDIGAQNPATHAGLQAGYRALSNGNVDFLVLSAATRGVHNVDFVQAGGARPALGHIEDNVLAFVDQLRRTGAVIDDERIGATMAVVEYFAQAYLG